MQTTTALKKGLGVVRRTFGVPCAVALAIVGGSAISLAAVFLVVWLASLLAFLVVLGLVATVACLVLLAPTWIFFGVDVKGLGKKKEVHLDADATEAFHREFERQKADLRRRVEELRRKAKR